MAEPVDRTGRVLLRWRNRLLLWKLLSVTRLYRVARPVALARPRKCSRYFRAGLRIARRYLCLPFAWVMFRLTDHVSRRSAAWFTLLDRIDRLAVLNELLAPSAPLERITISLVGASRKVGNPNHRLDRFFDSLCRTATDLDRIEVILRIDRDDDLLHYLDVKQRYGTLFNIRFVHGERKKGYVGLHQLVSETLDHLAPGSKLVFGFADDCVLSRQGWDSEFVRVLDEYPDNIIFINTLRDYMLPYEDPHLFFWILWCGGPPSLFTAVGRKALELTAEVARRHHGWTAYGNSVLCDSFLEALQFYLWRITGERRAPVVSGTIAARADILIPAHKQGGLFSNSPVAIEGYKAFLKQDTQAVIEEMAQRLAAALTCAKHDKKKSEDYSGAAPHAGQFQDKLCAG